MKRCLIQRSDFSAAAMTSDAFSASAMPPVSPYLYIDSYIGNGVSCICDICLRPAESSALLLPADALSSGGGSLLLPVTYP